MPPLKNLLFEQYLVHIMAKIVLVHPSTHLSFMFSGSRDHFEENIKKLSHSISAFRFYEFSKFLD